MSVQMKLGWWMDRVGRKHKVNLRLDDGDHYPFKSDDECWSDEGSYMGNSAIPHERDLIKFIRPLDTELPPVLNTAVKAAEDRVRELKQMVDESQAAWATACRLHEVARKELERLEKECEVKP